MIQVLETYTNETKGYQFGDSGWYEPYTDNRGKLFREMQKEYGRCTSKVYEDVPVSAPFTAFGVAVPVKYETVHAGWYFEKRMAYEDARGDPYTGKLRDSDYYTRGVWVQLREIADETEGTAS